MKLNSENVNQLVQLGSLATSLMDAATNSSDLVAKDANALASRLIALTTDMTKEPEPVKSSSPLTITEEQLADAIGAGRIPATNHPVDIARSIFDQVHGPLPALSTKRP